MQGYSVKTIDIFDEYTYNKGTDPQDMPWVGMRQIEITYNGEFRAFLLSLYQHDKLIHPTILF